MLPLLYVFLLASKGLLSIYIFISTYLSLIITSIGSLVCLPFTFLDLSPLKGSVITSDLSSLSAGLSQIFSQVSDFVTGLVAGQLITGPVFTNFMLISILSFVMVKLFLSFGLYKINLVPNR
jgi:hypothetical protein|tara:strand:+ start:177 stop:542 length:366 start_codon:yes stop_codon:yes gene_type:complete